MRVFGVVGWKNSGKTTMVERLVAIFTARGFTVSTMKHAHHAFDVDTEGRDSHRHRVAGAREVLVAGGRRWALMHELRNAPEPSLETLLARLSPVDLVLVEGFKASQHPKVEVHRTVTADPPIALKDPTIRAVASDTVYPGLTCPVLPIADPSRVADFIANAAGLATARG